MSRDRINDLFSEALATGTIPAAATGAERAELERLLLAAGVLRKGRALVDEEARTSMPVARARFERFLAEARNQSSTATAGRTSKYGVTNWLFGVHRTLATTAMAAGIALVAVAAVVVSQNVFTGVETASAEVLTPGDYVQVEGIVSGAAGAGDKRTVRVQSEFGTVVVAVSSVTSVVNDESQKDVLAVKKGDAVLISGLVRQDRSIAAQSLAVGAEPGTPPKKVTPRVLKHLETAVEGRIVFISMAEDGIHGSVLVEVRGNQFVVPVDARSMKHLLQQGTTPLGARVVVSPEAGRPEGPFTVQIAGLAQPGATPSASASSASPTPLAVTRPSGASPAATATAAAVPARHFTGVKGVVTGRSANVLQIDSARGPVKIVVRPETRVVIADSGLVRDAILRGESAIGHEVTISGAIIGEQVVADVIVLGPKVAR